MGFALDEAASFLVWKNWSVQMNLLLQSAQLLGCLSLCRPFHDYHSYSSWLPVGGAVARTVSFLKKGLGGHLAGLTGSLAGGTALLEAHRYRPFRLHVKVTEASVWEGGDSSAAVANLQGSGQA